MSSQIVRHPVRTALAAVAVAAVPLGALAAPAGAGPPRTDRGVSCAPVRGSLPQASSMASAATVTGVRSGRHACFDRLVIDLIGGTTGYRVAYVPSVSEDGSGAPVPVRGGARLQVTVSAPSYDGTGRPTYRPADRRELTSLRGYSTLRQTAWAGSFEGQTTLAVGVRARLPFQAYVLAGPGRSTRLVIDVAHHW